MKKFTKVIALILSLTLILCFPIGVSAAEPEDTGVDTAAKGSLTIYKVDLTNAEKDGAWDSNYVSTGVYDQNVNDTLNSYALKDVEFTYLRVADVVQLTGSAADGVDFDHVETLYGISKTAGADLLNALGLGNGANRYEKADGSDQLDDSNYYYQSKGDFSKVQFIMQNKTDGYYVKAKLDEATGVYYVTDHVTDKKDATRFVPTVKDGKGKILIKGLEDDEYTVTEIKTADGYTLLKRGIAVVISRKDASASATVDGKQATMLADNGSANALVPLSVVNTSGFDLPATGDRGVWMYGLAGILLMTASAACIIIARKRFK